MTLQGLRCVKRMHIVGPFLRFYKKGEEMAIRKALLNGKTVYAEQGEELRGAELTCIHCGAKMHGKGRCTRCKTLNV